MAARLDNNKTKMQKSIAEELMEYVNDEEYVDLVPMFGGTDYLNKTEVTAMKKMVSGKLWLDQRKFVNRQNQSITSGMFNMFGLTIGKSATDVRAEVCDHFLSPDNKALHEKISNSFKAAGKSYSLWISNMTSENTPCNEFCLYVLCHAYKRHVVVVLSTKLWCSFKPGRMTTFEKINKADHVLVWLGEDKFSEVKPLQIKPGIGNVLDWQLLSEAIDHTHEKRLSNQRATRRPDRSTDTAKTKQVVDITMSPPCTCTGKKRDSRVKIDYRQYHAEGIRAAKSPCKDKPLPKATGPSLTRLSAQRMITQQRLHSPPADRSACQQNIKTECPNLPNAQKLVKPEPGIFMMHRHSDADRNKKWIYVHRSGRPCPSGADGICKHKKCDEDELSDLPTSPGTTVTDKDNSTTTTAVDNNRSVVTERPPTPNYGLDSSRPEVRSVVTNEKTTLEAPMVLISPPPVERKSMVQMMAPIGKTTNNLGDLLCTLNFNVKPIAAGANGSARPVTTDQSITEHNTSTIPNPDLADPADRSVSTDRPAEATEPITEIINPDPSDLADRSVTTDRPAEATEPITEITNPDPSDLVPGNMPDREITPPNEVTVGLAPVNYDDKFLPDLVHNQTPLRSVLTQHAEKDPAITTLEKTPNPIQTVPQATKGCTPARSISDNNSQPSTTPRSVLTDPDDDELQSANALLQLGSQDDLNLVDQEIDNEKILPVGKAPEEDFTKQMSAVDANNNDNSEDSDKTVDYSILNQNEQLDRNNDETTSPKGVVRYKHYGIKRHSPTVSQPQRLRCITCGKICDSKKRLNDHFRAKHTDVTCPDCERSFPTPDALQRHRYIHKLDHQLSCDICGKECPFHSDLQRHMEKHRDNRLWKCKADDCNREFKCKAELKAHEIVHVGEVFMCEYPGCEYTNNDPRNVKRHYRVHTKEKTVQCKQCDRLFTYYQQMKRHLNSDH